MRDRKDSFVYIISDASGWRVKVGVSDNPWSRAQNLQAGNPDRLKVWHVFRMPSRTHAFLAEKSFHDAMSESQMCGEWFGITVYDALVAMCRLIRHNVARANNFDDDQMSLCMTKMGVHEAEALISACPPPDYRGEGMH